MTQRDVLFEYLDRQVAKEMLGFYEAFGLPIPKPTNKSQNMTKAQLDARIKELEECLAWYVQEDDTQEHLEGNTYWVRGKQRAMKALGIETEEYDAEPYL